MLRNDNQVVFAALLATHGADAMKAALEEQWHRDATLQDEFASAEFYSGYGLGLAKGRIGLVSNREALTPPSAADFAAAASSVDRRSEAVTAEEIAVINEFRSSAALQEEFGDEAVYLGFCRATDRLPRR